MEHRIQVLSVRTSLKDKTITLTCSADIDEDTVTPDSVCLALPSSGTTIPIKLQCDRRKIIASIVPEIQVNAEYRITTTTDIESVVGEVLEPLKALKVIFESAVVTEVKIVSPKNFETIDGEISLEWQEIGAEKDLCAKYQLQIASDNGFFNIVLDNIVTDSTYKTTLEAGQYYIRARAIKDEDYGKWSSTITFTIPSPKEEPVPNPQPEPKPRPGIPEIIDYAKKDGSTVHEDKTVEKPAASLLSDTKVTCDDDLPEIFEFVFDGVVNIDQSTVVIKRRDS